MLPLSLSLSLFPSFFLLNTSLVQAAVPFTSGWDEEGAARGSGVGLCV